MDKIHLLDQKVSLYQPAEGFKTTQDAVLLAAACPAKKQERILDLGCGVGGALFCLLWREPELMITGLDNEQAYLDVAGANASENERNVSFENADAAHFRVTDPKERFDHVICNPPYFNTDNHTPSPVDIKAKARSYNGSGNDLELWIKSALINLKPNGSLTMINQANKLDLILQIFGRRFGATEIIPIYSKPNEPAKRVIIRSYKDRNSPCKLLPPILMYDSDKRPTKTSDHLLRDGLSFDRVYEQQRSQLS